MIFFTLLLMVVAVDVAAEHAAVDKVVVIVGIADADIVVTM